LDSVVYGDKGKSCAGDPGAGAAGGAAYGLRAFLGAKFVKGIDFMLSLSGADKIFSRKQVDLIITGEGAIDEQTLQGKLIHGVLGLGKKHGVPVIGICGMLDLKEEIARSYGLEAVLQIRDSGKPVAYSMKNASRLVEEKIYEYLSERKYH
jgi:glycerate kinase